MNKIARRDFLRVAPAAAGVAVSAGRAGATQTAGRYGANDRRRQIHGSPDYPIQPKRPWDVTLTDTFWKPRMATNGEVTIPFQIEKAAGAARGPSGNVLEAAMLSLKTFPDPKLQAKVDAAVAQLSRARALATAASAARARDSDGLPQEHPAEPPSHRFDAGPHGRGCYSRLLSLSPEVTR